MRKPRPTIVLVENDSASRKAFKRLLEAHDYVVEDFGSAEAYLDCRSTAEAHCLLLDVNLDGISGLELQRRLRILNSDIPIVFMTGKKDLNVENCARNQGCSGFLNKPFNAQMLTETINLALVYRKEHK
jgi:FixJ family two-component response regulator